MPASAAVPRSGSAAVLTAAGSGTRLGAGAPKALVTLDGTPLLVHAAHGLAAAGCLDLIVVTAPPDHVAEVAGHFPHGRLPGPDLPVTVVAGGATRQASVAAGLAALPPGVEVVLVHDAARCLTPPDLVRRVEAAVRAGHRAVVPALAVTDTIKEVGAPGPDGAAAVTATPERSRLRAVQTPQGFDRELLQAAHAGGTGRAGAGASDDAALVEALGEPVWVIPGEARAMKITTPLDLALARLLLTDRPEEELR